jgi:hypothetical protein
MRLGPAPSNRRIIFPFIGVWIVFAFVYLTLRSNQFTAVDGALRSMQVYWRRPPYIGSNNHLLYPANVYAWSEFLKAFGARWNGPVEFVRLIQAMNAFFGAGAAALVYLLIRRLAGVNAPALAGALIFGISHAVLMHATNSAEPVVGLFVSLAAAAIAIEGIERDKIGWLMLSGFLLALALANYESMFLIAPSLLLMAALLSGPDCKLEELSFSRLDFPSNLDEAAIRLKRVFAMAAGVFIGVIAIYGTAFHGAGIHSPRVMIFRFLSMGGGRSVYGGWSISKAVNFPVGFIGNLIGILPRNYGGLRQLLREDRFIPLTLILVLLAVFVVAFAAIYSDLILKSREFVPRWTVRMLLGFGAAFVFFPNIYWDPIYDKLWLQPLAVIIVFAAVSASKLEGWRYKAAGVMSALIIIGEGAINLPQAWAAHTRPTACLADARAVAKLVRPIDKVVADFDPVSTLWLSLYDNRPSRSLMFPAEKPSVSLPTLRDWTGECAVKGCRILFINVLNQSRSVWNGFLGNRVGVPYGALDDYRRTAKPLLNFSCDHGLLLEVSPESAVPFVRSGKTNP